ATISQRAVRRSALLLPPLCILTDISRKPSSQIFTLTTALPSNSWATTAASWVTLKASRPGSKIVSVHRAAVCLRMLIPLSIGSDWRSAYRFASTSIRPPRPSADCRSYGHRRCSPWRCRGFEPGVMAVVRGILSCLAKATAIAMVVTAAGCAVGPDYHLPTDAVFDAPGAQVPFVGARGNHAVQKGELPPNWWHIYRSPDLDRLIADAIAENTDLRVADANLERSHSMVDLAKAAGQPKVGFEGGYERALLSAES